MQYRKGFLVALTATALALPALTTASYAFAASECTISEDISGTSLTAKIATCPSVDFTENVTVTGTTNVRTDHPTVFNVAADKTVVFSTTEGNALNLYSNFVMNNEGTVNFAEVAGRGISIKSTNADSSFTFNGGTFNVDNVKGYSVEAELSSGSLHFNNTTFNINLSAEQVEGAFNTGRNFGDVIWDNSNLNITDARDNERFKKTRAAHNVIYTENDANWTFRNKSTLNSAANVYYNLSFSGPTKFNVDNSTVNLTTNDGALMKFIRTGFFGGEYSHPQVGINTKGGEVNITNNGSVEIIDNVSEEHSKHGIEFENATYKVDGGTLITPSAGVDGFGGTNKLIVAGDSKVEIGSGNGDALSSSIETTVDGGTVVLPPKTTGVKNSNGDVLTEFVSDPTNETSISIDGYTNDYLVSHTSADGKKHVWAPGVDVYYYEKEADAKAGDPSKASNTLTLIKGTSVANPFNGVTPVFGTFKNADGNVDFIQRGSSATKVSDTTNVYRYIKPSVIIPVPTVKVTPLEVYKGDTVGAKDGITGIPENAKVVVLEPADTSVAGETSQKVEITFPDGSKVIKTVPVTVKNTVPWIDLSPAQTIEPTPETVEPTPETVESTPETVEPTPETVEPTPSGKNGVSSPAPADKSNTGLAKTGGIFTLLFGISLSLLIAGAATLTIRHRIVK